MGTNELDRYVAEVVALRDVHAKGGYILAKRLAEGEISGIWKMRLGAKGKLAYKNFDAFAKLELGMSSRYVRDMLKLHNQFTEEQFKQIGPSKLRLVAQVSPDARTGIFEKIRGGATKRQLQREMGHKGRDTLGAQRATIVREHERGGPIAIDVNWLENWLSRIWPLSDRLVISEMAALSYREAVAEERAAKKSRMRKGA